MPTLSACIRRAGKALDQSDAEAIREIAREYLADGMRNTEASNRAIDDYLDIMKDERADLLVQLNAQGGDITPYTGGIKISLLQQERNDELSRLRQEAEALGQSQEQAAAELRQQEQDRLQAPVIRYGLTDKDKNILENDPTGLDAAGIKLGATVEEMSRATSKKPLRKLFRDMAEDPGKAGMDTGLFMLQGRHMADFAPEPLKAGLRDVHRLNKEMEGRQQSLLSKASKIINSMLKHKLLNREEADLVAGVMARSTLAGVDPAQAYEAKIDVEKYENRIRNLEDAIRTGKKHPGKLRQEIRSKQAAIGQENIRKGAHQRLRAIYKTLTPKAQEIFTETRDMFVDQHKQLQTSLLNRIESLELEGDLGQAMRAKIEQAFENGKKMPYFPLMRYGSHWAWAKEKDVMDENGEPKLAAYVQFEKLTDVQEWVAAREAEGYLTDSGEDINAGMKGTTAKSGEVDPAFAAFVAKGVLNMESAKRSEVNELVDDIWQTYLQSLPEMSARKQFIHRKGVAGFTGDMVRAVADASLRNARRIGKVEYQWQIEKEIGKLEDTARKVQKNHPSANKFAASARQRHNWYMTNVSNDMATALTSLGFHNYLALWRPSAAIVNLMQTPMFGLPVITALASRNGRSTAKAAATAFVEMNKALVEVLPGRTPKGDTARVLAAIEEKFATFDITRVHDLLGIQDYGSDKLFSKWQKIAEMSGFLFHRAEVFNRQATALAAYRVAKLNGETDVDAMTTAVTATEDTHFDYGSQNRPPIMQNDALRVMLLFRNYSIGAGTRLAVDLKDSTQGATPQQRREARIRFNGIMANTVMAAGMAGAPLFWGMIEAANMALADWDEMEDMADVASIEQMVRLAIRENWGEEAEAIIMDGVIDGIPFAIRNSLEEAGDDLAEWVPNPSFSSRLSLRNLFFQDAPANAPMLSKEWFTHYKDEIIGPAAEMVQNLAIGTTDLILKEDLRELEKALPAMPKDQLKAMRLANEGLQNRAGATVLSREEISSMDIFMQSIGFAPYSTNRAYENSGAKRDIDYRIEWRADTLRDRLYAASRDGKDIAEHVQSAREFNAKFPAYRIDIKRAIQGAKKAEREHTQGVRASRRKQQELERAVGEIK